MSPSEKNESVQKNYKLNIAAIWKNWIRKKQLRIHCWRCLKNSWCLVAIWQNGCSNPIYSMFSLREAIVTSNHHTQVALPLLCCPQKQAKRQRLMYLDSMLPMADAPLYHSAGPKRGECDSILPVLELEPHARGRCATLKASKRHNNFYVHLLQPATGIKHQ